MFLSFQISTILCVYVYLYTKNHYNPWFAIGRIDIVVGGQSGQAFYWAKICVVRDFRQHLKEHSRARCILVWCDSIVTTDMSMLVYQGFMTLHSYTKAHHHLMVNVPLSTFPLCHASVYTEHILIRSFLPTWNSWKER